MNLSGVTDAQTLATAVNSAISAAGSGGSQQATAFKNAGIGASVFTDSNGASHLQFTSSTSAFQVEAGDGTVECAARQHCFRLPPASRCHWTPPPPTQRHCWPPAPTPASETVKLQLTNGTTPTTVSLTIGAGEAPGHHTRQPDHGSPGHRNHRGSRWQRQAATSARAKARASPCRFPGDTSNVLGLGTFLTGASNAASYTSITGEPLRSPPAGVAQNVQIAIGGQVADLGSLNTGAAEQNTLSVLNTALQGNALTCAANISKKPWTTAGNVEIGLGLAAPSFPPEHLRRLGRHGLRFRRRRRTGCGLSVPLRPWKRDRARATPTRLCPSIDANGTSTSGFHELHRNFGERIVAGHHAQLARCQRHHALHRYRLEQHQLGAISMPPSTASTPLCSGRTTARRARSRCCQGSILPAKRRHPLRQQPAELQPVERNHCRRSTGARRRAGDLRRAPPVRVQGGCDHVRSALGAGSSVDISSTGPTLRTPSRPSPTQVKALGQSQAAVGKGERPFQLRHPARTEPGGSSKKRPPNPVSATPAWRKKPPT